MPIMKSIYWTLKYSGQLCRPSLPLLCNYYKKTPRTRDEHQVVNKFAKKKKQMIKLINSAKCFWKRPIPKWKPCLSASKTLNIKKYAFPWPRITICNHIASLIIAFKFFGTFEVTIKAPLQNGLWIVKKRGGDGCDIGPIWVGAYLIKSQF